MSAYNHIFFYSYRSAFVILKLLHRKKRKKYIDIDINISKRLTSNLSDHWISKGYPLDLRLLAIAILQTGDHWPDGKTYPGGLAATN